MKRDICHFVLCWPSKLFKELQEVDMSIYPLAFVLLGPLRPFLVHFCMYFYYRLLSVFQKLVQSIVVVNFWTDSE